MPSEEALSTEAAQQRVITFYESDPLLKPLEVRLVNPIDLIPTPTVEGDPPRCWTSGPLRPQVDYGPCGITLDFIAQSSSAVPVRDLGLAKGADSAEDCDVRRCQADPDLLAGLGE